MQPPILSLNAAQKGDEKARESNDPLEEQSNRFTLSPLKNYKLILDFMERTKFMT